ncbi:MBL fold metallo-hydrolase RNA specificity domain-containing protein [Ferrimonas sp. SCSIO 43195]|uniref:MBL fold metallo-hydrolase RNA specificity domain-containing protein n=1 Tax=Ferrimonas sp. SCSIO 43195 TaxID=2822844 RepID=UPI002075AB95|nr:MBL fold metallo-hydrolase [Ferrimonas sp. SCSIO 43195]USD39222.1 MBL fold metallo-hydrolase [Ferrimonas sp. SCSIO 43195]
MTMTLAFLGAAGEVTGSCHLLTVDGWRLLLDCGLIQGGKKEAARNREPFDFIPSNIDAVILSHAHIDHSGRLPMLVKEGFDGPIFTHKATRELCDIMLRDAAMLQLRQTERANEKRQLRGESLLEPLFTEADVDAAMALFVDLEYEQLTEVSPAVTVQLRDAGHILGSAIIELWLNSGSFRKKLVFSGDLGRCDMPVIRDPSFIDQADLVVMESTYGDRVHRGWQETLDELKAIFARALKSSQGNILIPAFSVGRAQELLYLFHLYGKEWDLSRWSVYLDSPMATQATGVYVRNSNLCDAEFHQYRRHHPSQHPLLTKVNFVQTTEESMALNEIDRGLIIIAGSGMCNGGRIRCHLEHNLWRQEADIIICGYQAVGTPGRLLVDGAQELKIRGQSVEARARIHTIGGLSAHADQQELIHWYRRFSSAPPLVLVHGEPEAQKTLLSHLQPHCSHAVIAHRTDTLDLSQLPELVWLAPQCCPETTL